MKKLRPHTVTVNHYTSFHGSVSDAAQKDTETTHPAEFRECNISIMSVRTYRTALTSWKDTSDWCDTEWEREKGKNTLTAETTFLIGVQQCQLPFLSILHPLSPVPSTMKVEQICWHWSCLLGWPNFISAWETRLSPQILTDNCIYYFLFTGQ